MQAAHALWHAERDVDVSGIPALTAAERRGAVEGGKWDRKWMPGYFGTSPPVFGTQGAPEARHLTY